MLIDYIWDIIPIETPVIEKKCSRCSHNQFFCSEKFRINSNKKMCDVWLIYKCSQCHSTWNMNILTRANVSKIDPELFNRFQENDVKLAWQYAFDKSILKSNRVQARGDILFVVGDASQDILHSSNEIIVLFIRCKYELGISIKKILREKLKLSIRQIENLYASGVFIINDEGNRDLSRKIGKGCSIKINLGMLRTYII